MKIESDNITKTGYISYYDQGSIQIGTERFLYSIIVTPSTIIRNWPPQTFTDITLDHLQQILKIKPELILIGTGKKQCFPANALMSEITKLNIGIEFMETGAACRSYNILLQEGRNIAAALLMIK